MPDLFHYWLSGNAVCEYTNATHDANVNTVKCSWATGLMDRLGFPSRLPAPLIQPGTWSAHLLPRVSPALSGTPVIAPASHDTGSAVAAVTASWRQWPSSVRERGRSSELKWTRR